jgi:hypothetical protein
MQRRILVNYRIEPGALAAMLPAPFRPMLVHGCGVAGICLIRLQGVRPASFPGSIGLTSENAAHRAAVEWDTPDGPVTGVFVARRDTSSRLTPLVGGRLFPGFQHRASFRVAERDGAYDVEVTSRDGQVHIAVAAHLTGSIMRGSIFATLEEASAFFRCAPVGYAPTPAAGVFDGLELRTEGWGIQPMQVDAIASSFFEDAARSGDVELDSAFLMGDLDTAWHPLSRLVAP